MPYLDKNTSTRYPGGILSDSHRLKELGRGDDNSAIRKLSF